MALTGRRLFPIEDVPEDAFARRFPREVAPAVGQVELLEQLRLIYIPRARPFAFKRMRPVGDGVFGGRWFPKARGLVVWAHHEEVIERAVTMHEFCHGARAEISSDRWGRHDYEFLALAEDAYRSFGVPCSVAKLVEGEYPEDWSW